MQSFDITRTTFRVSDFLGWQRDDTLRLSPSFQRRSVWSPGAKSYLIDTIVRDLPIPIIFLRERLDLDTQRTIREVVDGQQRLRTVIGFIDPTALDAIDRDRDEFTVRRSHNKEIANKKFKALEPYFQTRILSYEMSTHILPPQAEDRDVLKIFARLNSTGIKLNQQELRNAAYFGIFKTLMYDLAYEQLDRWRAWRIFTEDQIARMDEVQLTSDFALNLLEGLSGRSQARINARYRDHDEAFPQADELTRRFRDVMDWIERILPQLALTVFRGEIYFFTLFVFVYDQLYGLGSSLDEKLKAERVDDSALRECLLTADQNFRQGNVPPLVLDAVGRASSDFGRRKTRLDYLTELCSGPARG